MKKNVTTVLMLLYAIFSYADSKNVNFNIADKWCSDSVFKFIDNYSISPKWFGKNDNYMTYNYEENGINKTYIVDTKTGKKKELFSSEIMAQKLMPYKDSTKVFDLSKSLFYEFSFENEKDPQVVVFDFNKKRFRYDTKSQDLVEVEKKDNSKSHPDKSENCWWRKYNRDSTYYTYAIDDDLYIYDVIKNDSIRLTYDGCRFNSFALGGNSNEKDAKGYGSAIGCWAGNGNGYFMIREDKVKVGSLSIVDNLAKSRPKTKTYKFPMPGDKYVPQYKVYIVNAETGKINEIDIKKWDDQKLDIPRFSKFPNTDRYVYFTRRSRTCDKIDLCRVDVKSLELKVLISEELKPHLNDQLFNYHIINNGKEILWWSECETGKGAYYLYDSEGRLKNKISKGDFVAGIIERIDTVSRKIIYPAYGGEKNINPHYKFYYSSSFDGKNTKLLTPGNGEHHIEFSKNGKFILDSWSRMDQAPTFQLCDLKGNIIKKLGETNMSAVLEKGWQYPEVIKMKAADGITDLWGVVYKPFDLDSTKTYPIITNVYPGPHVDLVPQGFTIDDNYNQSLAQLGFIVINFSYRGSCAIRGVDYHCFGYDNLRDYALADDKCVINALAKKYPYIDLNKVGIYGHSGGGFMTVAAMLTSPDFYKVGFSASGNHDNNIYTQWWGETFHGVKELKDKGDKIYFESKIPTNIELADNLKGRLMLVTGDVDNNVHPASTMRMAKALMDKGKRFDMMILPGVNHGVGDKYYINMIRYYFVENLLGAPRSNDINIIKHQ